MARKEISIARGHIKAGADVTVSLPFKIATGFIAVAVLIGLSEGRTHGSHEQHPPTHSTTPRHGPKPLIPGAPTAFQPGLHHGIRDGISGGEITFGNTIFTNIKGDIWDDGFATVKDDLPFRNPYDPRSTCQLTQAPATPVPNKQPELFCSKPASTTAAFEQLKHNVEKFTQQTAREIFSQPNKPQIKEITWSSQAREGLNRRRLPRSIQMA